MQFFSDNSSGASPRILDAVVRANSGVLPSYGADPHTAEAKRRVAAVFDAEAAVALVATGTAANALALAAVVPPGGVVFCHAYAHIIEEECAAPEFYTGAGKLVGVPGLDGKIDPDALRATLLRFPAGVVRQAQGACLSLSQATESGTLYTIEEIRTLADIAHAAGLAVHMDGARFANALVSLGCTAAGPAPIPSISIGVLREITSATRSGTTSSSAAKHPIASSRLTWSNTALALLAVLPTATKPPVQVHWDGISPTWPTTGTRLSHNTFWISSEAAQ